MNTKFIAAYEPQGTTPDLRLVNGSVRAIHPSELLIRVVATGICHTDLIFATWPADQIPYPKVLGHEGAGVVVEAGPGVTKARPGDFVLLSFHNCKDCHDCKEGHPSFCSKFVEVNYGGEDATYTAEGTDLRGSFFGQSSFAELAVVKETSVVNVTNIIKTEEELKLFAPLGCGFQTGAATVENVARANEKDRVAVLGLGGVGLVSIMTAKMQACRTIIGIDRVPERLELAKALGATHVINTADENIDIKDEIQRVTDGKGSSITIDTTGNMGLIKAGLEFTANRGQLIFVGVPPLDAMMDLHLVTFMQTGKVIRGTIEGDAVPAEYLPRMVQWYREGKLPINKLISFYKPENFEIALKDMKIGKTVKPVIVCRKRSPVVVEKQQRTQFRNSLQVILPKDPSSAASDDLDSPNDACLEPDLSVECGPESPSMCFESLWDQPEIDYPAERLIQDAAENCTKEPGIFEMVLNQRKDSDFTIISENSRVHQTEPKPASSSDAKLSGQSHIIYSYYSFLDLDISGLLPDDINYLEAQGCFRVPTPEALDEFVQEYFLHVHPALPLLDEAWFWAIFTRPVRGRSNLSLFVFQAMLFTACSFLPFSTLRSLGFASVHNARDTYYRRSKLLFDLCSERNLVSSAQGALLLSYNGTMKDQKRTNSIWLSTAIHLAQAAGADQFHTSLNPSLTTVNELKRLWWCCIVRDRILPLGMRRQLHITSLDVAHGSYLPTEKDFSREIDGSRVYAPQTKRTLVRLFITLCELTVPLTDVIKIVYPTGRLTDIHSPVVHDAQKGRESLQSCEAGLEAWFERATIQFPTPAGIITREESLVLYTNLLYIYYHAACFALYQHKAFIISQEQAKATSELQRTKSKIEDAALGITENLKELIQLRLERFLPISIAAYIAVPLVLHILDVRLAKRPLQIAQKQGKLNVYIETMKAMQKLYDGVDDVWTFIRTAIDYATVQDAENETSLQNGYSINAVGCLGSKFNLTNDNEYANDWGNVLVMEPVLYFRLSRTIDHSLALGRYSEDSTLGLAAPHSARLPSPRLFVIDIGSPEQNVDATTCKHDKASVDNGDRESDAGQDQLLSAPQMLEDINEFITYDFGMEDL
ncbi:fungal specific transcription factor domain-containing protein [Fusarium oxysporum f. sp. phaseoli]